MPPLQEAVIFCTLLYSTVVQHEVLANEDLMELEAQRTGEKRQEEEKRTKESLNTEHGEGAFLIWRGTVSFWGPGPKCRMVHEGCRSCSECNPVWPWWAEKKSYYPDITGLFFQEGRTNWIQQGTRTCAINVRHEWNCSLLSFSYCWRSFSSTISHLLSFLQSVALLACSPDGSPFYASHCTVLLKVLYCKIKNVLFIFYVYFFLCIVCIKSINLSQYSTIYLMVLVGYLG